MGGSIVHPDQKTGIPFATEAINRQDGCTKNDCEKNAIKRYFARLKREHPKLKLIILDDLYANNHMIALIKKHGWHYIIVAKYGNHVALIEAMKALYDQGKVNHLATNFACLTFLAFLVNQILAKVWSSMGLCRSKRATPEYFFWA